MSHILSMSSVILAAAVMTSPAAGQQVIFHEGFESGLSGWTATGLWNLEDSADSCGVQAAPFVEGTKCAWYGDPIGCNFDGGGVSNSGSLEQNDWIDLPNATSISLRFWTWMDSEYCWGNWDVHQITILAQNGPNSGFAQQLCSFSGPTYLTLPWHERRFDLSAYRGAQVRIRFDFDTFDNAINEGLGWLVDDVSIIAEPGERVCPPANLNPGCPCMSQFVPVAGGCRNSTGQSATLISDGTASVAADTLTFTAAHMPPGTSPTLFQGTTNLSPAVFGDGLRCTGGTQIRLGTQIASSGTNTWPAPGAQPLSVKGLVPPGGGTRYYQAIYRNSVSFCMPATFNLTDGQRVVWMP
jgi:hypothetical protein